MILFKIIFVVTHHLLSYFLALVAGISVLFAPQLDHFLLWPVLATGFFLYVASEYTSSLPIYPLLDTEDNSVPHSQPHQLGFFMFWFTIVLLLCFIGSITVLYRTGNGVIDQEGLGGWLSYVFEVDFYTRTLGHFWEYFAARDINLLKYTTFEFPGPWEILEVFIYNFELTMPGLFLCILTCVLYSVVLLSSWAPLMRTGNFYFFYFSSLIALVVCFLTDNFFIFYLAFEFILIPFFFIVGLWGSRPQRFGAAMRLVFFTVFFSLPLVVVIFSNLTGDLFSFRFDYLHSTLSVLGYQFSVLFYVAAFMAFGVKIPLFPAHVWLPEAHGEAPTFGSVLLAGILLKLGGFGFLQICFPLAAEAAADGIMNLFPLVYTVSVLTILYSNVSVFVQTDIKKTIAYYSIGHMGFVTLGLISGAFEGFSGAVVIMLAHGLSAAGLFFSVGYLYELSHSRALFFYRGIATVAPLFAFFFFLFICANMGLPGTMNFVGEQLVLASLIKYSPFALILPLFGILMNGISSILFLNRLLFGEVNLGTAHRVLDLNAIGMVTHALIAVPLVVVGLVPILLLRFLV